MSERHTPETDNNDYAHAFLEEYGYESSLQGAPVDWADFARRLERERDEARERADTMFVKHAEILDQYRRERDTERALADQLGNALEKVPWTFVGREEQASEEWNAIAAWKEARSD